MSELPGGDALRIIAAVGTGQHDALGQAVLAESEFTVTGCVFDIVSSGPFEEQTDVTTSTEKAWAFLPYVAGAGIPVVDAAGTARYLTVVDNTSRIEPVRPDALGSRRYKVIGQPEVQYDLDGRPDHVWIVCEWRAG